MKLKFNILA